MFGSSYYIDSGHLCSEHNLPIDHFNLGRDIIPDARLSCRKCQSNVRMYFESCSQEILEYLKQDEEKYHQTFLQLELVKKNLENLKTTLEQHLEQIKVDLEQAIHILDQEFGEVQRPLQNQEIFTRQQLKDLAEYLAKKHNLNSFELNFWISREQPYATAEKRIRQNFIEKNKSSKLYLLDDIRQKIQVFQNSFQNIQPWMGEEKEIDSLDQIKLHLKEEIKLLQCENHEKDKEIVTYLDMGDENLNRATCVNCENRGISRLVLECFDIYIEKFRNTFLKKYLEEKNKISEFKTLLQNIIQFFEVAQSEFTELISKSLLKFNEELNLLIKQFYYPFEHVNTKNLQKYGELHFQLFYSNNQEPFRKIEAQKWSEKFDEEIMKIKKEKFYLFSSTRALFQTHFNQLNKLRNDFLDYESENLLQDQMLKAQVKSFNLVESSTSCLTIDDNEKYLMYCQNDSLIFFNIQQNSFFSQEINLQSKIIAACIQSDRQWFAIASENVVQIYYFFESNNTIKSVQNIETFQSKNIVLLHSQATKQSDYCFLIHDNHCLQILRRQRNEYKWFYEDEDKLTNVKRLVSNENICLILNFRNELHFKDINDNNQNIMGWIKLENIIEEEFIDFQLLSYSNNHQMSKITIILFYPQRIVYFNFKDSKLIGQEIMFQPINRENLLCSQSNTFIIVKGDIIYLYQIQQLNENQNNQEQLKCSLKIVFSSKKMNIMLSERQRKVDNQIQPLKNALLSKKANVLVTQDEDVCKIFLLKILPRIDNFVKIRNYANSQEQSFQLL